MKVKDLIEKLGDYTPDLEIAIEEVFDNVSVKSQDWEFRMQRFDDGSSPRPYHKLVITPKPNDGQTAYEFFKSVRDDLE